MITVHFSGTLQNHVKNNPAERRVHYGVLALPPGRRGGMGWKPEMAIWNVICMRNAVTEKRNRRTSEGKNLNINWDSSDCSATICQRGDKALDWFWKKSSELFYSICLGRTYPFARRLDYQHPPPTPRQ